MKIGQTFLYKKSGSHSHFILVILHDYKENKRFLYCPEVKMRFTEKALLYAEISLVLTKDELKKIEDEYNNEI